MSTINIYKTIITINIQKCLKVHTLALLLVSIKTKQNNIFFNTLYIHTKYTKK
jgi:hypothetical protein